MCRPWLAAGVTCFVAIIVARELATIAREPHPERSANGEDGLLGARLRIWFRNRIRPVADAGTRIGLTANGATLLQLALSVLCGLAYGRGWTFTGGWLLITCGTLDVLDGEIARRQGRDGPKGAFIDSVVDRYGETAVFLGLVAYYRDDWMLWAILGAWAGAFLVSYARARAEGLGVECRGGMLQRPERYVLLGGTSMIGTIAAHLTCSPDARHGCMALGISSLAILANATALQRIGATLRRLA